MDLPRVRRTIRDHLARGARSFVVRFSLCSTAGHVLPCECFGQVLRSSEGGEPELLGGRLRPLTGGWESTRVPSDPVAAELPSSGNPLWSGTRRVLFVDHDQSILRLARVQLRCLGYAATTCSSAEEALAHVDARHFDAVVADERLPGMGGRGLAIHLARRDSPPVLVLTSGASSFPREWDDNVSQHDIVLDVEQIRKWAHKLGPHVTVARIEGALHDVTLSAEPAPPTSLDEEFATLRDCNAFEAVNIYKHIHDSQEHIIGIEASLTPAWVLDLGCLPTP